MLGVFDRVTAKQPSEFVVPVARPAKIKNRRDIAGYFCKENLDADVTFYYLENESFMAFGDTDHQSTAKPRSVEAMNELYCIFNGTLDNLSALLQNYGLSSNDSSEATLVCTAYKNMIEFGSFPLNHIIGEMRGSFSFMLFDTYNSNLFLARDSSGGMDLYWGTACDESLVCSNESKVIFAACGDSYSSIPQGYYFLGPFGLFSFDRRCIWQNKWN